MDKFDASYFLGPEYQRDSSLMHHLADLLVLAQSEGLLDVVDTELFLIIAEYIKLLGAFADVRKGLSLNGVNSVDADVRKRAADDFRKKAAGCDAIHVQLSRFIDYCAELIAGKS